MKRFGLVCACLWMVGGLVACGGDDDDDPAPTNVTFTELNDSVILPSCAAFSSCHDSNAPAGGLDLQTDPYGALVDVAAVGDPGRTLVIPDDAANSYLIEKLTQAMPAAGTQMPPNQPLVAERIALVRSWIASGAPDN